MTIASVSQTSTPAAPNSAGQVDATFKAMIDTLNDDSGAVSVADKAAAFISLNKSWSGLYGASAATKDYVNGGLSGSRFYKEASAISAGQAKTLADFTSPSKAQGPKSSAVFQKMLDQFDGLSADEQVMFATMSGTTAQDWRATTEARSKIADTYEAAQDRGEADASGRPTSKASAALKMLIEMSDQFDRMDKTKTDQVNAWTRKVSGMFDNAERAPTVRIDLSEDAKAYMAAKSAG